MTNKEFAPIPMTAYDEHSQAMQEAQWSASADRRH